MRVLLRADASPVQGTGHVMRCLTLAEALKAKGHDVVLMTNQSGVSWLEEKIADALIHVVRVPAGHIDQPLVESFFPDWVVTDSYEIPASEISQLNETISTLAIIDGDARGITAKAYLDHNLGAEYGMWPDDVRGKLIAGSQYVLIRDAVLEQIQDRENIEKDKPHILAVMGGSDPTGTIVEISKALSEFSEKFTATVIVGDAWMDKVSLVFSNNKDIELIPPTTALPRYLGAADIAISAAGTSAWELCTLAKPSLLIAVVDNQIISLNKLLEEGLVLGIDATSSNRANLSDAVHDKISQLIHDERLRGELSARCRTVFDGQGKFRVVEFMEHSLASRGNKHE